MLYPLTFDPLFKERIWGGRTLETFFKKALPTNLPIGESWEISDRPGDVSVINRGPLAGRDLHWLVEHHREALLGSAPLVNDRFPLLIKILDARATLSLQVHPPAAAASKLHGEPKTEMWFIARAEPGAELFAGLRRGVTRSEFEDRLTSGVVADCFHRLPVREGDAMFVPSGRVHAIGTGCMIFEVQQNSDTTYRVFDWNRLDPDGQARQLHIPQALESIDFDDIEPGLIDQRAASGRNEAHALVRDELFDVDVQRLESGESVELTGEGARIVGLVKGRLILAYEAGPVELEAGQFCLIPACVESLRARVGDASEFLVIRPK